ncbi:hypothetical protein H5410_013725 [Solanum commersonii]|uniref:Uncharacterized protein n=1 Tax=Solanum commersonii TaxID=4109 RepID=A0A9J5ZNY5_SOLCO|nr:hypothetical protein H5410_013725 [Solanum commersonii]
MASKLLMISVFVFDVIAFALAIAAEQRRSTATIQTDNEQVYTYCVYDSIFQLDLALAPSYFSWLDKSL